MDWLDAKFEWVDAYERANALRGAFGFLLSASLFMLPTSWVQLSAWDGSPLILARFDGVLACCVVPLSLGAAFFAFIGGLILCHQSTGMESAADLKGASYSLFAATCLFLVYCYLEINHKPRFIDPTPKWLSLITLLSLLALNIGCILLASFLRRQALRFQYRLPSTVWYTLAVAGCITLTALAISRILSSHPRHIVPMQLHEKLFEHGSRLFLVCFPPTSAMFFFGAWRRVKHAVRYERFDASWLKGQPPVNADLDDRFRAMPENRTTKQSTSAIGCIRHRQVESPVLQFTRNPVAPGFRRTETQR